MEDLGGLWMKKSRGARRVGSATCAVNDLLLAPRQPGNGSPRERWKNQSCLPFRGSRVTHQGFRGLDIRLRRLFLQAQTLC